MKVSLATTLHRSDGGQVVAHAKAMPGNPYDGHTLASVIPDIERKIGASIRRIVADRGYRGHNAPPDHKFKVFVTEQKRGMTQAIKREMRRRAAVEPVIGHTNASSAIQRPITARTETFSRDRTATPSTPFSPRPATTSEGSSPG